VQHRVLGAFRNCLIAGPQGLPEVARFEKLKAFVELTVVRIACWLIIACCLIIGSRLIVGDAAIVGGRGGVIVDHDRLRIIVNRCGADGSGHIIRIIIDRLISPAIQSPYRCSIDGRAIVGPSPIPMPAAVVPALVMVVDVVAVPVVTPLVIVPVSIPVVVPTIVPAVVPAVVPVVVPVVVPAVVPISIPVIIPAGAIDINIIKIIIIYINVIADIVVVSPADDWAIRFLIPA